ncbi:MAG: hypothetical protein K6U14_05240 [Firmicutes bacterium]|nr:hypothetical protein [Alicyclobacillaceae bacterium]MCL6497023.1 hypothetical protein [Bacillota bacterium]
MPELELTPRFRRQWSRLPPEAQVAVARALAKLGQGTGRRKALARFAGLFELRVTDDLRLTWSWGVAGRVVVRSVGRHDVTLKRP